MKRVSPSVLSVTVLLVVPGVSGIAHAMAVTGPLAPAAPATARAVPQDASKYSGFLPLVKAHKEAQDKMVKLWQAIKGGDNSEGTRAAYKAAQEVSQKAANKVTKFMEQEKWSQEDREAMNKIWSKELEKTD
jgi:hypothetical protein